MIRFKCKFKIYNIKITLSCIKYGEKFSSSFDTTKQSIASTVIYLGEDELMQENKWYDGIIELLYGEKFPPYAIELIRELSEPINLNQNYSLNCGQFKSGECELLESIEIIRDNSKIKSDDNGFIRDGINLVMKEE